MNVRNKLKDLRNIFLYYLIAFILDKIQIDNYNIKIKDNKELFFNPIYCSSLIELKTLKTFIEMNLLNNLRISFQILIKKSMLFVKNT